MKNFLIILVIAFLIIFIIVLWMGWKGYQLQKGEISIITDKAEYESGGILKVKIKNNFPKQICFSSCYPYLLESKNEEWESYKYVECQKFDGNGHCLKAGDLKAFELTLPEVSEGLHRLAIPVCIGCKSEDTFKEDMRFYSNEFKIKEKEEKIEEIINWKTFTNKRHKFEIKYPESWGVESSELLETCPDCTDNYKFKPSSIQIIIGESLTWEVTKANLEKGIEGTSENITVAGLLAIKREGKATKFSPFIQFEGKDVKEIIFMKDGIIYHFFTTKEDEEIFDQMLSTFRFLE